MTKLSKRGELCCRMHEKGMAYEEIADVFGVTKQRVWQLMTQPQGDGFRESTVRKIRYVGLRNWMLEHRINVSELERQCKGSRLHHCLSGDCEPRKRTIDAILKVTGMTYEECFKEESETSE